MPYNCHFCDFSTLDCCVIHSHERSMHKVSRYSFLLILILLCLISVLFYWVIRLTDLRYFGIIISHHVLPFCITLIVHQMLTFSYVFFGSVSISYICPSFWSGALSFWQHKCSEKLLWRQTVVYSVRGMFFFSILEGYLTIPHCNPYLCIYLSQKTMRVATVAKKILRCI